MIKASGFSIYKRVKRMQFNEFCMWAKSYYTSAYMEGLREGESSFDDMSASMTEERFLEVVRKVPGIGYKRAELILQAVLEEGNSYWKEVKKDNVHG